MSALQTSNTLVWSNISNIYNVIALQSNLSNVYSNLSLVNSNINTLKSSLLLGGAISDETTTLTTSNYTVIRAPYAFNISSTKVPLFWLNVLPTVTSNTVFDIQKNGNTIYTTKPQIGSTTTSNVSANGIPGTLIGGTNSVAIYDQLLIKIDTVGSGTPSGAKFVIYCNT